MGDHNSVLHYSAICGAIEGRKTLSFHYTDDDGTVGQRLVEPHLIGINSKNNYVLSAYLVGGVTNERGGMMWRTYFLDEMRSVVVNEVTFNGPRVGYNPNDRRMNRILFRL